MQQRHRVDFKIALEDIGIDLAECPERAANGIVDDHFGGTEGRYHAFQCFRLGYITGKGDRSLDLLFQRGETRCIARQYRDTVAACREPPGHTPGPPRAATPA